jgi:hypothetical protein
VAVPPASVRTHSMAAPVRSRDTVGAGHAAENGDTPIRPSSASQPQGWRAVTTVGPCIPPAAPQEIDHDLLCGRAKEKPCQGKSHWRPRREQGEAWAAPRGADT